ncbi:P-loop containing nucleoside triphosphate hydrolase protein [Flagelloscypha sp. PMI_526]|nr:P-loop containing nucleoside triphosphate hydrolase protein [Flagelloscypha sp. PMI_526]
MEPRMEDEKFVVHIEIRLQERATARFDTIKNLVFSYLTSSYDALSLPSVIEGWEEVPELHKAVDQIVACESPTHTLLPITQCLLHIHAYQPTSSASFEEYTDADGEEETMAASVCELPNKNWEGLWESLIYVKDSDGGDVKGKLLDYIHATLVLSDADINFNLVSWNRVVLLHGPPGTGKTSLSRALAQKLSIRLSHRFTHARLFEINSHSLFSKWFSESGKLVQRLFNNINELADESHAFLVVLIDEVESLTAARAGAMAGTEPSDGLRVVNALLTQLDKLKHRKNVLIMSTSNLVQAIDSAFIDRADIVQYIDLPSRDGIYEILRSSLCEMISKNIIAPFNFPSLEASKIYEKTQMHRDGSHTLSVIKDEDERRQAVGVRLLLLAGICRAQGLSGRSLRRLPVLALAQHLSLGKFPLPSNFNTGTSSAAPTPKNTPRPVGKGVNGINGGNNTLAQVTVEMWIEGIEKVVREKGSQLEKLI